MAAGTCRPVFRRREQNGNESHSQPSAFLEAGGTDPGWRDYGGVRTGNTHRASGATYSETHGGANGGANGTPGHTGQVSITDQAALNNNLEDIASGKVVVVG